MCQESSNFISGVESYLTGQIQRLPGPKDRVLGQAMFANVFRAYGRGKSTRTSVLEEIDILLLVRLGTVLPLYPFRLFDIKYTTEQVAV